MTAPRRAMSTKRSLCLAGRHRSLPRCRWPAGAGRCCIACAGPPRQARCEGKTGTLDDVSNFAGYCHARNGHTLAFALLMNGVYAGDVHPMQDVIAAALARYAG